MKWLLAVQIHGKWYILRAHSASRAIEEMVLKIRNSFSPIIVDFWGNVGSGEPWAWGWHPHSTPMWVMVCWDTALVSLVFVSNGSAKV